VLLVEELVEEVEVETASVVPLRPSSPPKATNPTITRTAAAPRRAYGVHEGKPLRCGVSGGGGGGGGMASPVVMSSVLLAVRAGPRRQGSGLSSSLRQPYRGGSLRRGRSPVRLASAEDMRHCYVLRVFTRGDAGGNHLGVVTDVTGLDAEGMQDIASGLGFSETIYVDWRAGGVPGVRIFTPVAELPFAGHPLVGAAWVLGSMGPGTVDRMRCGIGEVRFSAAGDGAEVRIPAAAEVSAAPEATAVARRAGLPDPLEAWWARMPVSYLVMEFAAPESVAGATPDIARLRAGPSARGTYLVAPAPGGRVKARFFAPALGVDEDPATGSAATALAAVRAHCGFATGSLAIDQGDEIGHPSTIGVSWDPDTWVLSGTVRRDEVRVLER
jgi:trans-2,3-dihydro-3-hydroxyanthranilate isomerase